MQIDLSFPMQTLALLMMIDPLLPSLVIAYQLLDLDIIFTTNFNFI